MLNALAKHGDELKRGRFRVRNWHGFHQVKEGAGRWHFVIEAFGDTTCAVAAIDDQGHPISRDVPIDSENRITINGRRYGREHWRH